MFSDNHALLAWFRSFRTMGTWLFKGPQWCWGCCHLGAAGRIITRFWVCWWLRMRWVPCYNSRGQHRVHCPLFTNIFCWETGLLDDFRQELTSVRLKHIFNAFLLVCDCPIMFILTFTPSPFASLPSEATFYFCSFRMMEAWPFYGLWPLWGNCTI